MKFRIHGSIENLDVQAHVMIAEVHGFNHVGAVEPSDTIHRLPICVVKQFEHDGYSTIAAQTLYEFSFDFDMDEVTLIRLAPNRLSDGLVLRYHVELAEDPPAAPTVPPQPSLPEAL